MTIAIIVCTTIIVTMLGIHYIGIWWMKRKITEAITVFPIIVDGHVREAVGAAIKQYDQVGIRDYGIIVKYNNANINIYVELQTYEKPQGTHATS